MHYIEQQWLGQFAQVGAFWAHNGDMKRHHALLTSGKHSDGFFNGTKVTENSIILQLVAEDLVRKLKIDGFELPLVRRVIGPAVGAVTFAYELSSALRGAYFTWETLTGQETNPVKALAGFTEKEGGVQVLKRFDVSGQNVLVCEDTITTGGSVEQTISAVESAGGVVLPFVPVICNRSGQTEIGGRKIISLIAPEIKSWEPGDCPICKAGLGSKALRPKLSWAELTGEGGVQ